MKAQTPEAELKAAVQHLIQSGSHFRLEEFPKIYSPDLKIVMVELTGEVTVLDYEQNIQLFQQKRASGAPPLDTTAFFNYLEVSGPYGYVVVTRHVTLGEKPQKFVFSLTLNKSSGSWKVERETAVVVR